MRLRLRVIVQRPAPTHRGKPLSHPECGMSSISGRKRRPALVPLAVDTATLVPYTPARRGTLPLMLPMSTPSRSGVVLIRVVARPPVLLLEVTY